MIDRLTNQVAAHHYVHDEQTWQDDWQVLIACSRRLQFAGHRYRRVDEPAYSVLFSNRLELFGPVVTLAWATLKSCWVTPIYTQSTTCRCRKPWHHVMSGVASALGSTSTAPLRC